MPVTSEEIIEQAKQIAETRSEEEYLEYLCELSDCFAAIDFEQ